jgi:hypothetical protein
MNIEKEMEKAREAYNAETSQVSKAYLQGFYYGLVHFVPEIKRLCKAIEEHNSTRESLLEHRACDKKLWEVLK